MYYLMLAQSALATWFMAQDHNLSAKSHVKKVQHDNIKWFKVFAVGAGPRFTN